MMLLIEFISPQSDGGSHVCLLHLKTQKQISVRCKLTFFKFIYSKLKKKKNRSDYNFLNGKHIAKNQTNKSQRQSTDWGKGQDP